MAGLIRQSDIDEVRSRTNIADIVGDYVTLKSAGVGSLKGLCPFHDERSPSFHVRPQVGFYHCFGCGEGGNVFTFLQRMDHVSFREAVERLASRIGYELHYEDGGAATDHGNRARLLAANSAAEGYFRQQLATPEAQIARDFLGSRGFDAAAAAQFGVGFAPKSFQALGDHLKAQGFTEQELIAAGLLSSGERGSYDRFRGRAVWPIRDVTGQTIGFGARKLLDDDQGPKYLNTPETSVYHKSSVLYGLDLARRDIARERRVVVVEGYTDVMACHLAGVATAVATCGTSFGVDHIKVVRRMLGDIDNVDTRGTGEVIFTFDPDEAGQKAATRAFAEEQRFVAQTFVAVSAEGLDPCDLRLHHGDEAIGLLIDSRAPLFEFMLRRVLAVHDLETVEGRAAALRGAAPIVAGIRDRALGSGYARTLAGWLGLDPREVSGAVTAAGRERAAAAARNQAGPGSPRVPSVPPASQPLGAGGGAQTATVEAAPERPFALADLPGDPSTRLERDALMAVLQHPDLVGTELIAHAGRAGFHNHTLSVIRDTIAASADQPTTPHWLEWVAGQVPRPYANLVTQLGVAPIPASEEQLPHYCRGVVVGLIDRDLTRRKAQLLGALQRAQGDRDEERVRGITRELVDVEAQRRQLRED